MNNIDHSYRFAYSLQENIKMLLKHFGLSAAQVEELDTVLYVLLIISISLFAAWCIKLILIFFVKRLLIKE